MSIKFKNVKKSVTSCNMCIVVGHKLPKMIDARKPKDNYHL